MDEPINWGVVASVVVPTLALAVTAWGYRLSHKAQRGTTEERTITQLYKQLEEADKRSDKQDARMARIEAEQANSKKRERLRDNYISALRHHIDTNQGPPAPPWPEGLYQ